MADIGYCYGSEWQLLRFLGHRRDYLCRIIQEGTSFKNDIVWADYPLDEKRKSQDGEWKGAYIPTLMARGDWGEIERKWKEFWPCSNSQQGQPSWDGAFTCGEEIVIVEAKAHISELKSVGCGAEKDRRAKITAALDRAKEYFGADKGNDWLDRYYQMANRLAFICFLNEVCGVKAKLLGIYFLGGMDKAKSTDKRAKSVKHIQDWREAINEEYTALGIKDNGKVKEYAQSVFIDCNSL